MFIHHLKYTLKILFGNKMLIFWTFAFPIILGTFFFMAFQDIEDSEKLDIIPIGVIENSSSSNNEILKKSFQELSDPNNENQLFTIQWVKIDEAKDLLEKEEIDGFLVIQDDPKIVVKENGINATIFQRVTEEILQTAKITQDFVEKELMNQASSLYDPAKIEEIIHEVTTMTPTIQDISNENLSYTMIEFYTLIAMTCLYGGLVGMYAMNQNLANMSHNGKRLAISPVPKRIAIMSSSVASYIIELIGIALLFLYTIVVLKVDYGTHIFQVMMLAAVGCLTGLSLGIFLSSALKTSDNTKMGILLAFTMLGCFFSGMMGITMKYVVDTNMPLLNQLNPANMITDGLYSLYYYPTFSRYSKDIISLFSFAVILLFLSMICLRRQKYDSI